jgi:hypothetical protein
MAAKNLNTSFCNLIFPTDFDLVNSLIRPTDNVEIERFCPQGMGRSKYTFGEVEPAVMQMWTGCIFETPPGYCLQIRSPINFPMNPPFHVMEGILETDWMQYDIWINLVFDRKDEWVSLRPDGPPVAQIVPVHRESIEADWKMGENTLVNRDTKEANRAFEFWLQYNQKKFANGGKQRLSKEDLYLTKDSTTFWKERQRIIGQEMEPNPDVVAAKEINPRKCGLYGKYVKPKAALQNESEGYDDKELLRNDTTN